MGVTSSMSFQQSRLEKRSRWKTNMHDSRTVTHTIQRHEIQFQKMEGANMAENGTGNGRGFCNANTPDCTSTSSVQTVTTSVASFWGQGPLPPGPSTLCSTGTWQATGLQPRSPQGRPWTATHLLCKNLRQGIVMSLSTLGEVNSILLQGVCRKMISSDLCDR